MELTPAPDRRAPVLVLAHGAGAGSAHPWMRRVARELAARGVSVITFDFPYVREGRRVPDRGPVLEAAWAEAWTEAIPLARRDARDPTAFFAGGKSMGGRIASQTDAKGMLSPSPAGLVFFGYPLHPPGKPEQMRDKHLPAITTPMLFVHGSRDPFGTSVEFDELLTRLNSARIYTVIDGDHSLIAPKKATHPGSSFERALDAVASWIDGTAHGVPFDAR